MRRAILLALVWLAGCEQDLAITHDFDMAVPSPSYDFSVAPVRDLAVALPPDMTRPTWHTQPTPVTTSLYGIYGSSGEIFVVGDRGTILRTSDGGQHWQQLSSGTTAALFGVWTDGATTIAVGYNGTVLRSVDDGASWQASSLGTDTLRAVSGHALDADGGAGSDLWIVGEGGAVLHSIDSGVTWTSVTTPAHDLLAVTSSPVETFIVGDVLARTRDDGATWTTLDPSIYPAGNAVWSSGSGQIVHTQGEDLYRSRDGGLTWEKLASTEAQDSFVGVAAFIDGELWTASHYGFIGHLVADFETVVDADGARLPVLLEALWGSDPSNLFVVGDNGFIAHRQ